MWNRSSRNIGQDRSSYLVAGQRTQEERWATDGVARVTHPKYGSVIVPHCSNYSAVRNAAEFWGCDWLEITRAQVWATDAEDKPIRIRPAYLLDSNDYKGAAMSFCKGCNRKIEWIRMKSGKSMPVDPEPEFVKLGQDHGKCTFITDEGETIIGTKTSEDTGVIGFVPHWATCPESRQFKRR